MKENDYLADLAVKGYTLTATKTWEPGRVNEDHEHSEDLYLFILDGEMTVTVDRRHDVLTSGQICEVSGGIVHSERVGDEGVTFHVAKR